MFMASTYKDVEVKCPFYKEQTARTISCEGITDDSIIKQYFSFPRSKELHVNVFCERKFENCEIYRMLVKKYEE